LEATASESLAAPESGVKFQAATLAKSTPAQPSTNRPVACPACHPNLADDTHKAPSAATDRRKKKAKTRPAVWSYNMRAHWARLHATSIMLSGLAAATKPGSDERTALRANFGFPTRST
jgi:hypothetical protein